MSTVHRDKLIAAEGPGAIGTSPPPRVDPPVTSSPPTPSSPVNVSPILQSRRDASECPPGRWSNSSNDTCWDAALLRLARDDPIRARAALLPLFMPSCCRTFAVFSYPFLCQLRRDEPIVSSPGHAASLTVHWSSDRPVWGSPEICLARFEGSPRRLSSASVFRLSSTKRRGGMSTSPYVALRTSHFGKPDDEGRGSDNPAAYPLK